MAVCAMLSKVCLGQRDLAAFAANLTREQMRALGFPRDWTSRIHRYLPPSESTFARMLAHLNHRQLQQALFGIVSSMFWAEWSRGGSSLG